MIGMHNESINEKTKCFLIIHQYNYRIFSNMSITSHSSFKTCHLGIYLKLIAFYFIQLLYDFLNNSLRILIITVDWEILINYFLLLIQSVFLPQKLQWTKETNIFSDCFRFLGIINSFLNCSCMIKIEMECIVTFYFKWIKLW